jgi:putative transposase
VSLMCRLYGVSRCGYYAWKGRAPSTHAQQGEQLREQIQQIYQASRGTYGSPRVYQALKAVGTRVGRKRVARIMRENGLKARVAKLYRAAPGLDKFFAAVPNRQLEQR